MQLQGFGFFWGGGRFEEEATRLDGGGTRKKGLFVQRKRSQLVLDPEYLLFIIIYLFY